jgi:hypothetical protein
MMWFDDLPNGKTWATLWSGYVRCSCGGIQAIYSPCPVCGSPEPRASYTVFRDKSGIEHEALVALKGGEGRYEDWVYLQMLQREWLRPLEDADQFLDIAEKSRPSPRAIIVLVFWTYFETRIERLLRETTTNIPMRVLEDLLQRYSAVGARIDRLYKILFKITYWNDLEDLGYSHVVTLLQRVQHSRNDFVHGHPGAIDNNLVNDLVAGLKEEHESWIAVFNRRIHNEPRLIS